MPDSPTGGHTPPVDWSSLLDAVAVEGVRSVLRTSSGARVVLIGERELSELEAAASRARAPRLVLTPREQQALLLVEEGLSTTQVAERMGVAHGTVTAHLAAARRTYDVRSSAQAVARAREAHDLA